MKYKCFLADSNNPYENLAMEHILCEMKDLDNPILFLWQNENTIVVGRNQEVELECKVNEFLDFGGKIARRHSGGGAVWHDLGNLNYSIICSEQKEALCKYQNLVSEVVNELGLKTTFNGRNDLLIEDKKFSGNAFYRRGNILCQHGTILVKSNVEKMEYFLTPGKEKMERNRVKSVSSRVVNLSEIDPKITVEKVIEKFLQVVDASVEQYTLDLTAWKEMTKRYEDIDWIYGRKFK